MWLSGLHQKYLKSETSLLGSLDSGKTLAVMLEQTERCISRSLGGGIKPVIGEDKCKR
jgi:hypothetical protein